MTSALTLVISWSKTSLHQATFTERQLRWRAVEQSFPKEVPGNSDCKGKMG